jgi:hypothetical protein
MKHRFGTLLTAAALAGLLAGARDASAQITPAAGYTPPDDTPKVNVGGTIYADYTYQEDPLVKDSDGNNVHSSAFNLTRAYINVTGSISHWVAFRITPDVVRVGPIPIGGANVNVPGVTGQLTYRLKYAYGQFNLDGFEGQHGPWLTQGDWIRFGQQQTPIVDYEEQIYRYRFQGTIFVEREGFLTSSDLGGSLHWVLPGNFGDFHGGVYNGEGYTAPETNDQKAYQVRGTIRPAPMIPVLKGLRITGFYDGDHYVRNAKKERIIGQLTFEHPYLNAGFDYLTARDQNASASKLVVTASGYSIWATPRTPIGFEALLRYDVLRPNTSVPGHKKRYIGGLSYWFPVTKAGIASALLADFEEVKYDGFPVGNANFKPTERRLALHTLFQF